MNYRQSAEVENQMTSVERVIEYSRLPSEAPLDSITGWFEIISHVFDIQFINYDNFRKKTSRNVAVERKHPIQRHVSSLY